MLNSFFHFRFWGLGKKLSGIAFALFFITFFSFVVGIGQATYRLMEERSIENITQLVGSVSNMLDIYDKTVRRDAVRANDFFESQFPAAFSVDNSQKIDVAGKLVDVLSNGETVLNLNTAIIDKFSATSHAVATIFLKQDDDFIRVTTSLKKENGERALGTALDKNSAAYAQVIKGDNYIGRATLFGKTYMTMYKPIKNSDGKMIAVLFTGIDIGASLNDLKDKIKALKIGETGYFYALNAKEGKDLGMLTIHPTKEGTSILDAKDASGREFIKEILGKKTGIIEYPWINKELGETSARNKIVVYTYSKEFNWVIAGGTYLDEITKKSVDMLIKFGIIALLLQLAIIWILATIIKRSITQPLGEVVNAAQKMAGGDLTVKLNSTREDEIGKLVNAMNGINEGLSVVIGEVRIGTESIASASGQIAAGNLDLSNRTESQASSLEETASAMEQLTSTVKQNADNARQANQLAATASEVASKGGAVVSDVVSTMGEIQTSARKIADIIGVIDSIAFQTNILALNAAVEAARAGEQGRGFAVVATEVRSLAQRSAAAAKEIKLLIDDSVNKVEQGNKQAAQAGATMHEVVSSVQRVTDIMSEISAASREQSQGIEEVNQAITQMDETTQQNAALVEQAAAAAKALQDQANHLEELVNKFKINDTQRHPKQSRAPLKTIPGNRPTQSIAKAVSKPMPSANKRIAAKTSSDEEWESF